MYKVFFNGYLLSFQAEKDNSFKDNIHQVVDIKNDSDFFRLIETLDAGKHVEELIINCRMSSGLWEVIFKKMVHIPAAGGLVTNEDGQLLFIRRFGRWDLPKGKIERHEEPYQAALREVEEECGLNGLQIVRELQPTFHLYHSPFLDEGNNLVLKRTSWFEMFHPGLGQLVPQWEEGIEEVRWFAFHEMDEVYSSTYPNLKELLVAYLD